MEQQKPKLPPRKPDVLRKLNMESLHFIERGLMGELPEHLRPVPVRGRADALAVAKPTSFLSSCLPVIPDSPQSELAATTQSSSDDEQVVTLKKSFSFRHKFSRMSMFWKDKDKLEKAKCKTITENEHESKIDHGDHKYKPASPNDPDHKHNKRFWFFRHKEMQDKKRHSHLYVRSKSFEFLPRALEEEKVPEKPEKTKRPKLKNSISYVFGSTDSLDDWISKDEPEYPSSVYFDNDDGVFLKGVKELPISESSTNSNMSIVTSASSGIVVNMFKTQSVQEILKEFNKAVEMFSENYLSDSEPYTRRNSEIMSTPENRKSSSFSTLPSPKVLQVTKKSEISEDFKEELSRALSVKRKSCEVKSPSCRRGSVTDWFVLEDQAAAVPSSVHAASEANKYRRAQKKPINKVRRISSTKYVSTL